MDIITPDAAIAEAAPALGFNGPEHEILVLDHNETWIEFITRHVPEKLTPWGWQPPEDETTVLSMELPADVEIPDGVEYPDVPEPYCDAGVEPCASGLTITPETASRILNCWNTEILADDPVVRIIPAAGPPFTLEDVENVPDLRLGRKLERLHEAWEGFSEKARSSGTTDFDLGAAHERLFSRAIEVDLHLMRSGVISTSTTPVTDMTVLTPVCAVDVFELTTGRRERGLETLSRVFAPELKAAS